MGHPVKGQMQIRTCNYGAVLNAAWSNDAFVHVGKQTDDTTEIKYMTDSDDETKVIAALKEANRPLVAPGDV